MDKDFWLLIFKILSYIFTALASYFAGSAMPS